MNRRPLLIVLSVLGLIACIGFIHRADPFEKNRWKIDLVSTDSGVKDATDTIGFKGGKFISEHFAKLGFKEANYDEDTRRGGLASFTVDQSSEKEGKLHWTGTVTASAIRGDLQWTRTGGDTVVFTYTGERLPQPK